MEHLLMIQFRRTNRYLSYIDPVPQYNRGETTQGNTVDEIIEFGTSFNQNQAMQYDRANAEHMAQLLAIKTVLAMMEIEFDERQIIIKDGE